MFTKTEIEKELINTYGYKNIHFFNSLIKHITIEKKSKNAYILAGGSGSGKTTSLNTFSESEYSIKEIEKIDSDYIKIFLEDYYTDDINIKNTEKVHTKSSAIANLWIADSIENGYGFVYDGTFKNMDKYNKILHSLQKEGYNIHFIYCDCSIKQCIIRALTRASKTGREVPFKVIIESNIQAAKNMLNLISSYETYSSILMFNTEHKNELFYTHSNHKPTIHDQNLFDLLEEKNNLEYSIDFENKLIQEVTNELETIAQTYQSQQKIINQDIRSLESKKLENEAVTKDVLNSLNYL